MRKVTIKDVMDYDYVKYVTEFEIANDIMRLAYEGELFTTDGEQITLEFINKLFEHSRVFESITKDVMNRLQTNRIEGYAVQLGYYYRKTNYNFEEVKGCIIDTLGSYGKILPDGTFEEWDIELYPYSFEPETFESLVEHLACPYDSDEEFAYINSTYKEFIEILKKDNIKKFLQLELTRVYDKDGKLLNIHTVKDEIKDFCFERKEKFTNEMVMKVFMACKEISIKC